MDSLFMAIVIGQKQSPGGVLQKVFLQIRKIHRKTPVSVSFFNKAVGLSSATLLKNRLWHSCFPVNFPKSLRTTFFKEHLRWLVLIGLHFVTRMKINPISCKFLTQVSFNHYREQQHFQVTDTPNSTISINTMLFGSKKTR